MRDASRLSSPPLKDSQNDATQSQVNLVGAPEFAKQATELTGSGNLLTVPNHEMSVDKGRASKMLELKESSEGQD